MARPIGFKVSEETLKKMKENCGPEPRPIRNVQTGQVFRGAVEAAASIGITCECGHFIPTPKTPANIYSAIRKGIKSYGYNWEFV